ncbi:MAG: hypothetical protein IKR11_00575 [Solobacterium sp.]|nr:hypothetical protein [Solobacterium sp.]
MTVAEIAMIILIFLIAVGMVMILAYKPKVSVKQAEPEIKKEEEIIEEDIHAFERMLSVKWPEAAVLLEKHVLSYCILFRWAGLHGNKKTILIDACEEEQINAVFEAVMSLSRKNAIPENDFWIVATRQKKIHREACDECSKWLRAFDRHIDFILQDGMKEENLLEKEKPFAFLTIGEQSSIVLKTKGNWTWDKMKPSVNEVSTLSLGKLKKHLPWQLRMQWLLHKNMAIQNTCTLIPSVRDWFYPSVEREGDTISVYAGKDSEEVLSVLNQAAITHGSYLKLVEETQGSCSLEQNEIQKIEKDILSVYDYAEVLPVLQKERIFWHGFHVYGFHPSGTNLQMIQFYEKIMQE